MLFILRNQPYGAPLDICPHSIQRPALLELAKALSASDSTLRRDECSDWRINGTKGHIYAVPEGFQIFVFCESKQGWTYAKRSLSFMTLCNDGDEEGGFILTRLPTPEESEIIREKVGIRKKPEYTPEHLAQMRETLANNRLGQKNTPTFSPEPS